VTEYNMYEQGYRIKMSWTTTSRRATGLSLSVAFRSSEKYIGTYAPPEVPIQYSARCHAKFAAVTAVTGLAYLSIV
jgi:hypothetical protein